MGSKLMWTGEVYRFVPSNYETSLELPSGAYQAGQNERSELLIQPTKIVSDRLVSIPSPEFDTVVSDIDKFLSPEIRQRYKDLGFVYKRSFFLYGSPGTGKSCLVNRVAHEVMGKGGIVLINTNNPNTIQAFLQQVRTISPDRMIMVVMEEFDAAIKNYDESGYLTMLDGQIQVDNVVYMATTNYIELIPPRLLRPGRFSRSLEIGYPTAAARKAYIEAVFPAISSSELKRIVTHTKGCSIDECREVIQAHLLLGDDIRKVVRGFLKARGVEYQPPEEGSEEQEDYLWDNEDRRINDNGVDITKPVSIVDRATSLDQLQKQAQLEWKAYPANPVRTK